MKIIRFFTTWWCQKHTESPCSKSNLSTLISSFWFPELWLSAVTSSLDFLKHRFGLLKTQINVQKDRVLRTIPILVNPKTEPQTDNKHSTDLTNEQQPFLPDYGGNWRGVIWRGKMTGGVGGLCNTYTLCCKRDKKCYQVPEDNIEPNTLCI